MNKIFGILLLVTIFTGCESKDNSPTKEFYYEEIQQETFNFFINKFEISGDQASDGDIAVYNDDYPFYFWLYENNKFFYDLPGLAQGVGDWEYTSGGITLKAVLSRFDLLVLISKVEDDQFVFSFEDRHGPKIYKVKVGYE